MQQHLNAEKNAVRVLPSARSENALVADCQIEAYNRFGTPTHLD